MSSEQLRYSLIEIHDGIFRKLNSYRNSNGLVTMVYATKSNVEM